MTKKKRMPFLYDKSVVMFKLRKEDSVYTESIYDSEYRIVVLTTMGTWYNSKI